MIKMKSKIMMAYMKHKYVSCIQYKKDKRWKPIHAFMNSYRPKYLMP